MVPQESKATSSTSSLPSSLSSNGASSGASATTMDEALDQALQQAVASTPVSARPKQCQERKVEGGSKHYKRYLKKLNGTQEKAKPTKKVAAKKFNKGKSKGKNKGKTKVCSGKKQQVLGKPSLWLLLNLLTIPPILSEAIQAIFVFGCRANKN